MQVRKVINSDILLNVIVEPLDIVSKPLSPKLQIIKFLSLKLIPSYSKSKAFIFLTPIHNLFYLFLLVLFQKLVLRMSL